MIKHKPKGSGYIFWYARLDSELPTKANSWRLDSYKGRALIKELGLND